MLNVYPAESYRPMQLGSLGNASYMLLAQFNFPATYEENEQLWSRDSDRLQEAHSNHVAGCLRRFGCGFESFYSTLTTGFEGWILKQSPEDLRDFVTDILHAAGSADWTGYRIMGTVNDRGHAIYSFQLFARDPNGNTQVYTGEPAPNVLPGRRHR
jgi:hypothetical protein